MNGFQFYVAISIAVFVFYASLNIPSLQLSGGTFCSSSGPVPPTWGRASIKCGTFAGEYFDRHSQRQTAVSSLNVGLSFGSLGFDE